MIDEDTAHAVRYGMALERSRAGKGEALSNFMDIVREAVIEECAMALEADAKLCDCAALEERECACGAWDDYKTITSARAVEIVRALKEQSNG